MRWILLILVMMPNLPACMGAQPQLAPDEKDAPTPSTAPAGTGRFPHFQVDFKARQIRVDCQALRQRWSFGRRLS